MTPGPANLPSGRRHAARADADLAAAVEALWARLGSELLARVDTLEEALTAIVESRLDEELRRQAERDAHRIVGSAGTFGRHQASTLARHLEELFTGSAPIDASAVEDAVGQVERLRTELSGPPHAPAAEDGERTLLLVVHRSAESAAAVAVAAEAWGVHARTADSLDAARRALGEARPQVALVDLALPGGGALELAAELVAQSPPVVTLALMGGAAFADRVEAVRMGVRGFVADSLPAVELVGAAVAALEAAAGERWQVLAVDDDPSILAALSALLEPAGLAVTGSADPQQFWAALDETGPDLAVLDVDMPGASGIELCHLLRADPKWATLPVVVLTARADRATVEAVFAAGADDFVVKPILGPELLTRITNRLERTRILRTLAEVDPLTGLANRRKLEAGWARLQAMADRYDQPLSFALLDLDGFRGVNNRYGHDVGDAVLRRVAGVLTERFRAEDVVARWGGEEIALALYGMTREDGVRRVDEALQAVAQLDLGVPGAGDLRVSFSAGVSEYRRDGDGLRQLYLQADEALYLAKGLGGGAVLPAGRQQPGREQQWADVVVVEDDDVLAELLAHGLSTRGHRSVRLRDGEAAVGHLTGPSRQRARLVLLDITLPGLDGFAVLEHLRREGVLERTRVIVLTGRSREDEVLRALELGAVDHVAKPFSVPVLMQRIHRALSA